MQSLFPAQPGSAWQTLLAQIFPAPQSRAERQATQLPVSVSQTGVAAWAEQSESFAQLPDSPGVQQPFAQWLPVAQAESSLQDGDPTQKPWSAQTPPAQVCGDGQSLSAEQGRAPCLPPQASAAARAKRARDRTCASSATP